MPLNPKLTKFTTATQAVASFPAEDLASGTGAVLYYLSKSLDASGTNYIITPNAIEPNLPATNGFTSADQDFDLSAFNLPRTIKGKVNFIGQFNFTSGTHTMTVELRHVESDGTTETAIGTAVTSGQITSDTLFNFEFEVARTQFKKGEILRLNVSMSNSALYISIDPTGAIPTGISSSRLQVNYLNLE